MAIVIGAAATDRSANLNPNWTSINLDNPANGTGIITSVELYALAGEDLEGCKVGTFSRDGDKFTCRDYATIGDVIGGSKQTFGGLSINCVAGDYIGIFFSVGLLERDISGYAGVYSKSGDQFDADEQTYTLFADDANSLYGTGVVGVIAYFFNSRSTGNWTDPDNMINGLLANYATTTSEATETLDGNTCPGTDLGTITKVEIRVYGYGDGDDRIDLWVKGGFIGDEHQTTPGVGGAWSSHVDITSDSNAPSPWTWPDVDAVDIDVEKDNSGKANAMYCAKVEIRATYTPTAPPPSYVPKQSGALTSGVYII